MLGGSLFLFFFLVRVPGRVAGLLRHGFGRKPTTNEMSFKRGLKCADAGNMENKDSQIDGIYGRSCQNARQVPAAAAESSASPLPGLCHLCDAVKRNDNTAMQIAQYRGVIRQRGFSTRSRPQNKNTHPHKKKRENAYAK